MQSELYVTEFNWPDYPKDLIVYKILDLDLTAKHLNRNEQETKELLQNSTQQQ